MEKKKDRKTVFLAYANLSFRDDIKNLSKIFKIIISSFPIGYNPRHYEAIYKRIVTLVKYNDPLVVNDFQGLMIEHNKDDDPFIKIPFETAVETVYGYRNGYCENECFWRHERRVRVGHELFSVPNRIKCFECDQIDFIEIIKEIIAGKEYTDIEGFQNLLSRSQKYLRNEIVISKPNDRQALKEVLAWRPDSPLGFSSNIYDRKGAFRDVIYGFVSYSLVSFLLNNDRRKLRACHFCNRFFIAEDLRQKKCKSETCFKKYKREQKRKQREENPVKYI